MISIVLYGRNDSYGYNLHKRAALSFNCMAELLTDENDEILFVDYNTPDDFPTFPEAIQDTLTPLARRRLRILRVRPPIHRRFQERTRLVALEPVSRNVAVRRSNPANRWILSTNTDMVFVPRGERSSLSDIVRDLPPGFYHAPRLEIPETLWEGLDRQKPQLAIETIKDWGSSLHLNEIVQGAQTILYDGPGDFQLIERADLFRYHGFDEEMILGWHVDSNIAKRLFLVYGKVGDLGEAMFGYHCDHTRQITPAHSHTRTENDWRRFVENLTDPDVASQAESWGCAGDAIEEIRLDHDDSATYVAALRAAIGAPLETVPVVTYAPESYGKIDYDPRHVLPFLADLFVSAPRNSVLAWAGVRWETLELFARVWRNLGFSEPIMVDEALAASNEFPVSQGVSRVSETVLIADADMFVVDFGSARRGAPPNRYGGLTSEQRKAIGRAFLDIIGAERLRWMSGAPPRRIACLNAIHTPYETLVRGHIGAGLTPFATRMRHGFAFPPMVGKQDWTWELQVGAVATRSGQAICARPGAIGILCYGPYRALFPGRYRIEFEITGSPDDDADPFAPIGTVELIWGLNIIDFISINRESLAAGRVVLELDVDDSLDLSCVLQTVVRTSQPATLAVASLFCETIPRTTPSTAQAFKELDWLSALSVSAGGQWAQNSHIALKPDAPGFVCYGPYWIVASGRYQARVEYEADVDDRQPFLIVDVYSDGRHRAMAYVNSTGRKGRCAIEFEVHEDESPTGELPIELRLRGTGASGVITAAKVRRIGDAIRPTPWIDPPDPPADWPLAPVMQRFGEDSTELDWLGLLKLGPAGQRIGGSPQIELNAGVGGFAAYGPYWSVAPGRYSICLEYQAKVDDRRPFLIVEVFSGGRYRAAGFVNGTDNRAAQYRLEFEAHEDESPNEALPVEIRLRTNGAGGLITAVKVRRVGEPSQETPWVAFPQVPPGWPPETDFSTRPPSDKGSLRSTLKALSRRLSSK